VKGLCFKCNEKYGPDNRCKYLFMIEAYQEDEDGDVVNQGRISIKMMFRLGLAVIF
jgi:hypothetical protein